MKRLIFIGAILLLMSACAGSRTPFEKQSAKSRGACNQHQGYAGY